MKIITKKKVLGQQENIKWGRIIIVPLQSKIVLSILKTTYNTMY